MATCGANVVMADATAAGQSSTSLADSVLSLKTMMIGVGLTDLLPDGCAPGGLYGVFNTQQMKLVADYLFIR